MTAHRISMHIYSSGKQHLESIIKYLITMKIHLCTDIYSSNGDKLSLMEALSSLNSHEQHFQYGAKHNIYAFQRKLPFFFFHLSPYAWEVVICCRDDLERGPSENSCSYATWKYRDRIDTLRFAICSRRFNWFTEIQEKKTFCGFCVFSTFEKIKTKIAEIRPFFRNMSICVDRVMNFAMYTFYFRFCFK
jgi:hypothetical protein